jgi:hypothetical protein
MENTRKLNSKFEAITWGALFIWWGITELVKSLPAGAGLIGIGLILLGLNAARYFNAMAINGLTTTIGVLALLWGGLVLAGALLSLPFELPVFAILLIALGVIVLGREFTGNKNH